MLRRPTFYAIVLLLLVMIGLTWYMAGKLDSPELRAAVNKVKQTTPPAAPVIPVQTDGTAAAAPPKLDPELQRMADQINSADTTPERDLEIVREFISIYSKAFGAGNPIGLNEDITAALTGTANPKDPRAVFPRACPAIRNGQIVDRWGTPLWFHPESGSKMEIRSAGPDKDLFTSDDIILNR